MTSTDAREGEVNESSIGAAQPEDVSSAWLRLSWRQMRVNIPQRYFPMPDWRRATWEVLRANS